jgi:hypothetical protein
MDKGAFQNLIHVHQSVLSVVEPHPPTGDFG